MQGLHNALAVVPLSFGVLLRFADLWHAVKLFFDKTRSRLIVEAKIVFSYLGCGCLPENRDDSAKCQVWQQVRLDTK